LILVIVPESRDPRPGRLDLVGVVLSILGLVLLVYGIIRGGEHSFGAVESWGTMLAGLVVLGIFIAYERRSDHPSLDVRLFRDPRFSAAVASIGLVFFAAMGTLFFLSFYLQLVRGYSPLLAGALMTPFAAAQLIFSPQSAAMVRRFGPKRVCAVGLALVAVALGGFVLLDTGTPIWVLGVFAFIQGAGMANVMPPATESIMSTLPREKAGVASAVNNTVRQVGGALGIAVLGSVLSAVYRSQMSAEVATLPAGRIRDAATESISGAYGVAPRIGAAGSALTDAANHSFITAMHWAAIGSALVALLGVVVVLAWLPSRSAPHGPEATPAGDAAERELAERR
jgi:Na+/melibiose symporter-like transporter